MAWVVNPIVASTLDVQPKVERALRVTDLEPAYIRSVLVQYQRDYAELRWVEYGIVLNTIKLERVNARVAARFAA